jgi:transposase
MVQAVLGIDISKQDLSLTLLVKDSYKKKKILNTPQGFKELTKWLHTYNIDQVKACMEATGSYGEKIADYLYEKGHQVHVVNPACIKSFAQSKLSRHKTDEIDSLLIAEYASKNDLRLYQPKSPLSKELRALYRCLQNLKNQQTQTNNFLENKELLPKSVRKIYQNITTHIESQIKTVHLLIDKLLVADENLKQDCENLQTIPGIGLTTAVAILAEIPDISALDNARQLAAYAGLTPRHRTSGTSVKGKSRLSKIGSAALRKALYFPAIVAKNHNSQLIEFAKRLENKRKHSMVIIAAIMRKLLHICFGILKHKTPFNPALFQNIS